MAKDDEHSREVAAKIAELKAKATPEKIKRMTALFQAEVARRDAAKKAAARPTASAAPPGDFAKGLNSHALEVLKRWRDKR
ncbi:hypothetical protein [Roseiterribacter gracilis]|uniref:Uncharacterized protein n=1 Tax=Roseiterribacter gracilis TaxID=2812848 RepID=A0A8S8XGR8_9PROT|nr:hypothetical protein TMPK1_25620 [Rhodospirillales bacterium TMPK1]